jgi:hypothetical protein
MLEFLDCYKYPGKSAFMMAADVILSPFRQTLGYRTFQYNSDTKTFVEEDIKARNIFFNFLLICVSIVAISLVTIAIKFWNSDKKIQVVNKEEGSSQPKILTKELIAQYLQSASIYYQNEISELTLQNIKDISKILDNFSVCFNKILKTPLGSTQQEFSDPYFKCQRKVPHVIAFEIQFNSDQNNNLTIGSDIRLSKTLKKWSLIKILEGYIQTLPQVLGTGEIRLDEGCHIFLEGIEKDPFDKEHITSSSVEGDPVTIKLPGQGIARLSKEKGFVIIIEPQKSFMPPKFNS